MAEMEASLIPDRLEALTADWLSQALQSSGRLASGRVASVASQVIGDGEGFLGIVARLLLCLEGAGEEAPRSVIAKLPTDVLDNRTMGELMGVYWREIHFYQELAARVPVRTPAHHYSALSPDPMRHRQYRIVSALDRLPYAFVDLLTRLAKRSVARSGHRYLLLIEDLGDARVGDQVAGASREECAQVLEAAARMHARFWGGAELEPLQWLAGQTVNPRMRHRMYRESRPSFEARHAGRMPDVARRVLEYLDARGVELIRALHRDAPETLIHCDLRFDNVFFDGARAGSPVIFADWQLVGRGAAAYDVAYFLSGALSADAPAELETDLLRGYHRALVRAGAPAYDFERLRRDYQRGLVAVFQILATTDQMDLGDARGARLMDAWVARALSRLAGVDLGALL